MSEFDNLNKQLCEQKARIKLTLANAEMKLIIEEADLKVDEYLQVIKDGREWLKKVEDILEAWGKTKDN